MSTFIERLIQEKSELSDKREKLESFISSENFGKIDAVQQSLLNVQIFAMKTYEQVLVERIAWLQNS